MGSRSSCEKAFPSLMRYLKGVYEHRLAISSMILLYVFFGEVSGLNYQLNSLGAYLALQVAVLLPFLPSAPKAASVFGLKGAFIGHLASMLILAMAGGLLAWGV